MAKKTPLTSKQFADHEGRKKKDLRISSRKVQTALKIHETEEETQFDALTEALQRIEAKLDPASPTYMLKDIEAKLNPISETYTTVGSLGKWTMALLVAISIVVGIIWGIIQIVTFKPTP